MRTAARSGRLVIAALLGSCVSAGDLLAQAPVTLSAAAELTTVQLARDGALQRSWSGAVLGARGGITFNRYTLEAHYAQGSLTPATGTLGDGEDLVDGVVLLRVYVRQWLSVAAGPRLRAYVTPSGTARWARFEARARAEGELINGLAYAHFEGWYAVAADANIQGGGTGAQGGEAGLSMRLPRAPVVLQLTYAADRATFANGASEFLEGVSLGLRFGRF